MDDHAIAAAHACTSESDAGRKPFPEVLASLAGAGIERYHADLLRGEKVYYLPGGESVAVPCAPVDTPAAAALAADGVAAAVRAAQTGEAAYPDFRRRIVAAGCVGYHVSLSGRRAVYYGRDAAVHVEHFPD